MMEDDARDELLVSEDVGGELAAGTGNMAVGNMAIAGAVAAGVAGAAVWAGIALATGYEIGWIAWGIGAAVGATYVKLGGRSAAAPMLCAAIAVASIAAGKYMDFRLSVNSELDEIVGSPLLRMQF